MQEIPGIVYLLVIVAGLVLARWIGRLYHARAQREVQETIRAAVQAGQTLTPETISALMPDIGVRKAAGRGDLRWGLSLLAVALAVLIVAALSPVGNGEDVPDVRPLVAGLAAFPGLLGLAFLVLHLTRPKDIP